MLLVGIFIGLVVGGPAGAGVLWAIEYMDTWGSESVRAARRRMGLAVTERRR